MMVDVYPNSPVHYLSFREVIPNGENDLSQSEIRIGKHFVDFFFLNGSHIFVSRFRDYNYFYVGSANEVQIRNFVFPS